MNPARTVLGTLLIIIGLPILFGVIWAVGLTQAVVSSEFLVDLPQKIVKQVPELVEESIHMALMHADDIDVETHTWVKAIDQIDIKPSEVMKEAGILSWLDEELSLKLSQLNEIIENKREPENLYLDLRSLKKALLSPAVKNYFLKIVNELPPCDDESIDIWKDMSDRYHHHENLVPCRPDPQTIEAFIGYMQMEISDSIPNEVEIFQCDECIDFNFEWIRFAVSLTFLLFLFPAFFLVIGSLIASRDRAGFLKWCGISVLIGGLIPFLLVKIIESLVVSHIETDLWLHNIPYWSSVDAIFLGKIGDIYHTVLHTLFAPVGNVAGIVAIIGLVLFSLSFLIHTSNENSGIDAEKNKPVTKETGLSS